MEILEINNVSFKFPDMKEHVLDDITMTVKEGEFIVICGPSGCGKTTFLRLLKKELAPVGNCVGDILYAGKLLSKWDERVLIEDIGFVFQDPDNQIVMDEVMQEIVFGLENLGYSNFEMRKRVAEMVHFFGMEDLLKSKPSELSGGQKQMLNLLSVLLLKPKVLLLDEPTSQLDPVAAKDLIVMLERLNNEMGMTIILVEHRLEDLFAVADRVLMMEQGRIKYEGISNDVIQSVYNASDDLFIPYIPSISRLFLEKELLPNQQTIPLTVKEGRAWLTKLPSISKKEERTKESEIKEKSTPYLEVKNVYYQYNRNTPMVLKNFSLQIQKGEYFALVGGNGSGKTTALKACLGMIKPQRGSVRLEGKATSRLKGRELYERIAYLPQNPRTYFMHDTVEEEMQSAVELHQLENGAEKILSMLRVFGITYLRKRHPYDCSGGEMQKAALASMLLGNPDILFIDEPTKGLDPISKQHFANVIHKLHQTGLTIVMVTHDIEFIAKHADRCAMLFDGEITVDGSPKQLFQGNYFYTTTMNRVTRDSQMSEVLTLEEALEAWPNHVYT